MNIYIPNCVCIVLNLIEQIKKELIDEEKTVFFSTHIISDLEKIADYIVYLKDGSILLNESVNASCMFIERVSYVDGDIIEYTQSYAGGNNYKYTVKLL